MNRIAEATLQRRWRKWAFAALMTGVAAGAAACGHPTRASTNAGVGGGGGGGAAVAADAAPPVAKAFTLSVVGTNDLHGHFLAEGDRGGLALLGGYLANLRHARATDGGGVILVDAGDAFQ